MTLQLRYRLNANWPPGAWIAHCRRDDPTVEVVHGAGVAATPHWFGEVVWDGPYADGGFDGTDVVFGSGGRRRNGNVSFVSAASTVDRLQALERGPEVWISNSLACLLAASGAGPDPAYRGYPRAFRTIARGLRHHQRSIPTSAEPVRLVYFNNVCWDGARLSEVPKPNPHRDLTSFARYTAFVEGALEGLAENMDAAARPVRYGFLGTVSSGYDSAAVAALARRHGLREVITFTESRSGQPDGGAHVAAVLGLTVRSFPRDGWQTGAAPEIPFLAGDAKGEDVYFRAAGPLLHGRVLVTGFHGDKMWDAATRALSPDIVRGDQSGLSLTEYRLWAGFIHFPVAFLGVRQIRDVHALARSPELAPWDVGGGYTRPICRRLVEEAGVPREAFGQRKNAVSVHFHYHGQFLSHDSTRDFLAWLAHQPDAPAHPALGRPTRAQRVAGVAARLLQRTAARSPSSLHVLQSVGDRLETYANRERLFVRVFPWAIERVMERYRS